MKSLEAVRETLEETTFLCVVHYKQIKIYWRQFLMTMCLMRNKPRVLNNHKMADNQ